jgi:hypothetical protein
MKSKLVDKKEFNICTCFFYIIPEVVDSQIVESLVMFSIYTKLH